MKRFVQQILVTLAVGVVLSTSAHADNAIPFSGVVLAVKGHRLEVELQNGSRLWGTMDNLVPSSVVGQKVTGSYAPAGDTNRIVSPVFEPINQ